MPARGAGGDRAAGPRLGDEREPSARAPRWATKRSPGRTWRESTAIPVTSTSGAVQREGRGRRPGRRGGSWPRRRGRECTRRSADSGARARPAPPGISSATALIRCPSARGRRILGHAIPAQLRTDQTVGRPAAAPRTRRRARRHRLPHIAAAGTSRRTGSAWAGTISTWWRGEGNLVAFVEVKTRRSERAAPRSNRSVRSSAHIWAGWPCSGGCGTAGREMSTGSMCWRSGIWAAGGTRSSTWRTPGG